MPEYIPQPLTGNEAGAGLGVGMRDNAELWGVYQDGELWVICVKHPEEAARVVAAALELARSMAEHRANHPTEDESFVGVTCHGCPYNAGCELIPNEGPAEPGWKYLDGEWRCAACVSERFADA